MLQRCLYLVALVICTVVLCVLTITKSPPRLAFAASYACTEIIGFSQTWNWWGDAFNSNAGPGRWQLRWYGGATIDLWADPNYWGWSQPLYGNQCTQDSDRPMVDRVMLTITGDFHTDVNWWVQQIRATINNVHAKYPSARQIMLQPVVGGPGGAACYSGGNQVRATFNQPYINQAINQVVGGDVVAGDIPQVRSCGDYADEVGHLVDGAQQPIGGAIGAFYAQDGVFINTPTPTPTSAPPTTPTPTSTPGSDSIQTVNFDGVSNPNRPLTGEYPGELIDWGSNGWYVSGPYGRFSNNSVSFDQAVTTTAFSFVNPSRLIQLDAYNGGGGSSTITLTCSGQPSVQTSLGAGQMTTLRTGWTGTCDSVSISSSNGWQTNFNSLVVDRGLGPAKPASRTTRQPTATPTPTRASMAPRSTAQP